MAEKFGGEIESKEGEKIYYVQTKEGLKVFSKEILDQIPATSHTWPVDQLSEGGKILEAGWATDPDSGDYNNIPNPASVLLGRRPTKEEFPNAKEEILARSEATATLFTEEGKEILPVDADKEK